MPTNRIIVTTTSLLDGWEIEEYIAPISSHVVAGTGFISDIFADFSDFFGGRSKSYQKQISWIHEEAIEALKRKAKLIGANCILGLSIDHDEISGKGKAMFMVTAVGTAVRVSQKKHTVATEMSNSEFIEYPSFNSLKKRKEIIAKGLQDQLVLNSTVWDFIIDYKVHEIAPYVLKEISNIKNKKVPSYIDENSLKRIDEYLYNLEHENLLDVVYNSVNDIKLDIFPILENLVKEHNLVDYEKILQMLDSKVDLVKRRALVFLQYSKMVYLPSDFKKILVIYSKIKELFPNKATFMDEKSKISKKNKKKWLCECGKKNDLQNKYCVECRGDYYGFTVNEVHPVTIMSLLKEDAILLKQVFKIKVNHKYVS